MKDFIVLIIFFIGFAILLEVFTPKIKGRIGERRVEKILNKLDETQYKVLHNVMLMVDGKTTQIDHIVVSIFGIFVIETKNYQGWISGSEYAKQWTKTVYRKKYKFQNPLHQNYGHVQALISTLELEKEYFIPIVVFSDGAELKLNTKQVVINRKYLWDTIQGYQDLKLLKDDIVPIANQLENRNVDSKQNRKAHVSAIHTTNKEIKDKIKKKICPKCGGNLVERTGKYGKFWACSNYPKCRFTQKWGQ